jgi:hypothetical protein
MRLLSRMNDGRAWGLSVHSPIRGTRTDPALSRERARWKSVLLDQQAFPPHSPPTMFRLGSNDSSVLGRCPPPRRRARGPYGLSLLPPSCGSVAATGVSEVSRFSCLKFLGVSGVFDYAGLNRSSRYRACSCCLPPITKTSASGLHLFGAEYPPHLSSIYASLGPSR